MENNNEEVAYCKAIMGSPEGTPLPAKDKKLIRKMHQVLNSHALIKTDLANALWQMFLWQEGNSKERIKKITELLMPKKGMSACYDEAGQNMPFDWNENSVRDLLIWGSSMYGRAKRVKGKGYLSELEMIEQAESVMNNVDTIA